ncbi:hypothetical protein [Mycobacterium intracellulare]|uniref:Helix-turn-helix domain-containing protein n=1 Tax=Mycobacterium intracellulare TaxID=1767 RepID=A0AAE4RF59_MYCIT|nr:hypothetical protein [Mycobacterium intracellulare]MDV6979124.1 hypothetical protein [Mycobacterium intracellulare]MDV6984532.1 hypothetical protein [Mycobacterium intracellulare]MDV7014570.1 hypothetical protein [Mycobacterium intracellulare]MDV7029486.1 hypothetical protein [Mycobacterium intracellulare]
MVMGSRAPRGRPVTGVREAARILGCDMRTVRRRIESGQLEGVVSSTGQRRRWFVYSDQLIAQPAGSRPAAGADHGEIAALRAEVADLRARALAAEEGERLLLAGHATLRDALRESQSALTAMLAANERMMLGTEGYRAAADNYRHAADQFREGATGYVQVVSQAQTTINMLEGVLEQYSDTIAQHITPGHPGQLDT